MHKKFLRASLSFAVFIAFACGAQYARAMDPEDDYPSGGIISQGPGWSPSPTGIIGPTETEGDVDEY